MMYRCSKEILPIAFLLLSSAFPLICGQTVRGIEGQSVTIPCSYRVKQKNDITSMCWGRGSCPNSQCNDVLIRTDGHRVTQRTSERHQLSDDLTQGRVSLTISQATMRDAGTYCCRIEHPGWFNDEKKNIQLIMIEAPTTTPPTTTRTTRPRERKTTPPPTTTAATTPPATTVGATTLLPVPERISTLPTTPARATTTPPTGEQPSEATTVPSAERTTTPEPITTEPAVTATAPPPEQSTALYTTSPSTTPFHESTTPQSTDLYVSCNISHEMIEPHEAFDHHHPRRPRPSQPAGHPEENDISDFLSGNATTVVKKESGLQLHILIIAICLSVIVLVAVSLLILKFRGKERGRYLFGLDPNLELVSHAEAPLTDTDVEISQTVTLEVDRSNASRPAL